MDNANHKIGLTFYGRAHTMLKCEVLTDLIGCLCLRHFVFGLSMDDRVAQRVALIEQQASIDVSSAIAMGAEEARREWHCVVDTVLAGEDVVVERYSRPTVAVIAYDDYAAICHELEALCAARRSQQLQAAWQQGKIKTLPWETLGDKISASTVANQEQVG